MSKIRESMDTIFMTQGIQRLFIKNNTAFLQPFFDNIAFWGVFFPKKLAFFCAL